MYFILKVIFVIGGPIKLKNNQMYLQKSGRIKSLQKKQTKLSLDV